MRKIMEPGFYFLYLVAIITFGVIFIVKSKDKKYLLPFGIACAVLGVGDAFHLLPRAVGIFTDTLDAPSALLDTWLGTGKLVTSVTMTVFYVLLYISIYIKAEKNRPLCLDVTMCVLLFARLILLALPQNEWATNGGSLIIGIVRNIPFTLMGALVVYLAFKYLSKRPYKFMWLMIILSFAFYLAVVIWAGTYSWVGMLMLPKTICYLVIGGMGVADCIGRKAKEG